MKPVIALCAVLFLLPVSVVHSDSTQTDAAKLTVPYEPSVTLHEALSLAEQYIADHKIDVSQHFMHSVRLVYIRDNPQGGMLWHVLWLPKRRMEGDQIHVYVSMAKGVSVDRTKSEFQQSAPTNGVSPPSIVYNVEFSMRAPTANAVSLVGDFNHWDTTASPMGKRPDGEWRVVQQVPPGRHQYKFVVDGREMPDPDNKNHEDDGKGGWNSIMVIGQ